MAATRVAVALDWTPNTNHTGLFVARARGWYRDVGLDVELLSPQADGYKATPAQRLAEGAAHFALAPSESVVSSHFRDDIAPGAKLKAGAGWLAC